MRLRSAIALGISATLAFACKSKDARVDPAKADASAMATPGAAPTAAVTTTPTPPLENARMPPNLLEEVPAKVAVSSTVDNPHDFPEHVFDGRMDTAWNSKTGDLRAWIAFRVPVDARVHRIEMTSGFDKISKAGEDLFTANHRITKIAVSRDGKLLKNVALDPSARGLQTIPIDGPGGDYKVAVLETKAGTKANWKEIVVSEMRVVGTPGKERSNTDAPLRISVGGLDVAAEDFERLEIEAVTEKHPTLAAYCASSIAAAKKAIPEAEKNERLEGLKAKAPTCHEVPVPVAFAAKDPYLALNAVERFDGFSRHLQLVAQVPRGFMPLPFSWRWEDPLDPGCPSIVRNETLEEVRVEGGHLVIVYGGDRITYVEPRDPNDHGARVTLLRGAMWCKDEASGLTCTGYSPSFNPPLGDKIQPSWTKRVPWASLPWKRPVSFQIAPDGKFRRQG